MYTVFAYDASERRYDYRFTLIATCKSRKRACAIAEQLSLLAMPSLYALVCRNSGNHKMVFVYHAGALVTGSEFANIDNAYARDVLLPRMRAYHNAHAGGDSVMRDDMP